MEEFGDIFRLSRPTAYREVSRGSVRSIRTAGTIRIPVSEVFRRFREAEALPEVPKAKAQ
ncbi:hypothetical protein TPY_0407 [Sulfobacillus acidophilus TPY]|nr:hypothetical protein TPY_0407 [Sulfobacillus acidophilus TPY]